MTRSLHAGLAATLLLFVASLAAADDTVSPAAVPQAPARFGIVVDDRYRSLEFDTAETRRWIADHATATQERMASLPGRAALRARYDAIDAAQPPIVSALQPAPGGRMFYVKRALGETIGRLYVRDDLPERMLVDADIGPTTRFSVSPDGRRVLLAEARGAASTVTVIDVARGSTGPMALVDDAWNLAAPRWRPDGSGFWFIAMADAASDGASLQLETYDFADRAVHRLPGWGDAAALRKSGDGDGATIVASLDGRTLFVAMRGRQSPNLRIAFAPLNASGREAGPWTALIDDDAEVQGFAVHGSAVYARAMKDATLGRLMRYDATRPGSPPVLVFAGSDDGVLQDLAAADDGIYLVIRHFYAMSLVRIPFTDPVGPVALGLPHEGSIRALATDPTRAGAVFVLESWTDPATQHRAENDRVTSLALQENRTTIGRDWVADETTCAARDGARIPMTVVHRKGIARDGTHPLLLNGYGGYGFVEPAYFYPKSEPWVEHGGVFADFMPRGSGANGEAWHRAGTGPSKPNTWHDLEACAATLIEQGYTSPDRLIIQGTGIGGLMVGRAMTDRPDLFAAVVMRWPITDALRFIESPAHRAADEVELGKADSAQGVAQLVEDSVDAHVRDVRYPAVMLTTGLKDGRFPPWLQSKTAARLEAVQVAGRRPVLLRVDAEGGAGLPMTLAQRNDELADRVAFMLWSVGDPAFQPRP